MNNSLTNLQPIFPPNNSASLLLAIAVVFIFGLVIGYLFGAVRYNKNKRHAPASQYPENSHTGAKPMYLQHQRNLNNIQPRRSLSPEPVMTPSHMQPLNQVQQPKKVKVVAKKAENAIASTTNEIDDLTKIEGIGPKIAQVLYDGGIATWTQLSQSNTATLREILEKAGGRYRMHDPKTWPRQARYAAAGRWKDLKKVQQDLKGGR